MGAGTGAVHHSVHAIPLIPCSSLSNPGRVFVTAAATAGGACGAGVSVTTHQRGGSRLVVGVSAAVMPLPLSLEVPFVAVMVVGVELVEDHVGLFVEMAGAVARGGAADTVGVREGGEREGGVREGEGREGG